MKSFTESTTEKSERDEWATPPALFNQIQEMLNIPFVLDVCATENNKKTSNYLNKEDNALITDWLDVVLGDDLKPVNGIFMNPPYSNPYIWCEKASIESKKGLIVVGLLNDDRSTKWYQDWIEGVATLCYVPNKRISFLNPQGEIIKGNPKGQIIPVWTPWNVGRTEYIRFKVEN